MQSKGFTFLEVMIAISVITIGIIGIYTLIPRVISITSANIDKFIASQLGEEGIEVVRNIRDSNWLKEGTAWDNGLTDGDWRVQYDKDFLLAFSDEPLKIDGNGFYNYDVGSLTKFKRKVTVSHLENYLNVKVQITWPNKTSPFEAEENLYDWR